MENEPKTRPKSGGIRGALRIVGPVVTLIGIGLVVLATIGYYRSVGTIERRRDIAATARTYRPPDFAWCRWASLPVIAAGIVMTSIGFDQLFFKTPTDESQRPQLPNRQVVGQPLGQLGTKRDSSGRRKRKG